MSAIILKIQRIEWMSLLDAMQFADIQFFGKIDWSSRKIQRFKESEHKSKKNVWVWIRDGGASFGNWRTGQWENWWEKSYDSLSRSEKSNRTKYIKKIKIDVEKDKNINDVNEIFNNANCKKTSLNHPYVIRKKITPYFGFQIQSKISLPIYDINGEILSAQYITDDYKWFEKDRPVKGGYLFLSDQKIDEEGDILWICEGWATGCSIYQVVREHVICALSANNILDVAVSFRRRFQKIKIVICADNDSHLEGKKEGNVGVINATRAAAKTNSILTVPPLHGDFNDFLNHSGVIAMRNHLFRDF